MSWEELLGNTTSLDVPKIHGAIAHMVSKTALFVRQELVANGKDVDENFQDEHSTSLSFSEEKQIDDCEEKKNKPKFTYEALATESEEVTGEDGKKRKRAIKGGAKKTVTKNKTKWITPTADFRSSMSFLLRRFVNEMREFYDEKGGRFPDESSVLTEFLNWSSSQTTGFDKFYLSPLILTVSSKINVNKIVEPVFGNLDQQLFNKVSDLFKDANGASPNHQINKMIGSLVQFFKLIAVKIAYQLWYRKSKVDSSLVLGCLRDLVIVANREVVLEESFFKAISDYNEEVSKLLEEKRDEAKQKKAALTATTGEPAALGPEDVADIGAALDNQEEDTWDENANIEDEF